MLTQVGKSRGPTLPQTKKGKKGYGVVQRPSRPWGDLGWPIPSATVSSPWIDGAAAEARDKAAAEKAATATLTSPRRSLIKGLGGNALRHAPRREKKRAEGALPPADPWAAKQHPL